MKKKLIAAILSLALVASLVPATAFATDSSAHVKTNTTQTKQQAASTKAITLVTVAVDSADEYVAATPTYSAPDLTFAMKSGVTRVPSKATTKLTVTKPTEISSDTWVVEGLDSNGNVVCTSETVASTDGTVDIIIGKSADKLKITHNKTGGAETTTADLKGLLYSGDTEKVDKIIETFGTTYDSAVTATFAMYPQLADLHDKILGLEDIEKADLKSPKVAKTQYDNFKAAYDDAKEYNDAIVAARTAINKIPTGALNVKDLSYVNDADTKIGDANREIGANYGKDPASTTGGNYTIQTAIGQQTYDKFTSAKAIMGAVMAINKMPEVTDATTGAGYKALKAVDDAIKAVEALKVVERNRVGNMDEYTKKMKRAEDAASLISLAELAISNAEKAAKPSKPFYEAQVLNAKAKKLEAIEAIEAVGKTLAGSATWTTWTNKLGDPANKADYKQGSIGVNIVALEKAIKSDAKVQPFIKLLNAMPASDKLAWSDKAAMFELTTAYADLKTDPKSHFDTQYTTELKKLKDLKDAQEEIEKKNLQAAVDLLTKQINALPATVTLNDEDAIELVKSAVAEYTSSGYLVSTGVYATVDDTVKAKYDTAVKALKKLTDVRDENDKEVVKPFITMITGTDGLKSKIDGSGLKLSDKAFVEEARTAYNKFTDSQKALVETEFETLEEAEEIMAQLEGADPQTVANNVIVAIRSLPASDKLALTDADAVYAVNDKYLEAIKVDGVKAAIGTTNEQTLFTAVGRVMDLQIEALPILKTDEVEDKATIDAAAEKIKAVKAKYDSIGKPQQDAVTKAATLDKAVTALSTAMVKYADVQLAEIAKIDLTKELTAEQVALIKDGKAYIDKLSDTEKTRLHAENLKNLDAALKAIEDQENAGKTIDKIEGLKNVVYTGKAQTPAIKVMGKDGKEIAADNYTVKYYSNTNVGQATVIVKAKADSGFIGEAEATFIITPAKASIASLQVAKAKLRVNIKPMSGVKHRIAYKLTSSKSYKGLNTSLTSKVLPGIKAKKKYTVKVRAYIKVDGKTYFGAYSPIKHATTK